MIQVADNFNYRGKKPNFDRDSFDTLQDMKNYSENSLDDGHISYCKETDKHYKFNSNNQSDPTTGKWVEQHEAVPADEEDITEQNGTLQLANKTYDKQSFSGLGRVYLRKNIVGDKNVLTQAMINKANTIYVIQYDYDLNGQTIVTPSNSILKFDGGSFDNGIVDISNTTDLINPKFNKNCKIAKDTILKDFVDVRTLGIYPDDTDYGWSKLDNLCNKANTVYFFPRGIYKFTSGIKLYQSGTTLIGECTYADIMTVNDESLRGTVFDFSISSGTSEEPKYCINFADSYSSGIERITIHSNSVQELKDNRELIDGERTVEEIWTVRYNNTYIRGVRGGNINLVKFMKISDYAYYLEGAYANITNCSFYKCNKCMRLTQDNVVNNIKVFYCNYFASLNALNILTNCRIDSCKYDGILIYYRGNTVNNVVFDFIYQRSFVLNPGANHNNINFTTLRSGIGSYKKDYSDKNSKYYTIYMQGECNACDINLNITSNNILDSTTENISFIARGILLDQNFSGVNNKFNINREDINLVSSIRNNTLVKDIVKYIDYKDIPTLNMVANLGGVSIEYIKGKPVISGDMYVSKMGTTQERPANIINKGFQYFDTTINKPIFWDGAKWIDATGATV